VYVSLDSIYYSALQAIPTGSNQPRTQARMKNFHILLCTFLTPWLHMSYANTQSPYVNDCRTYPLAITISVPGCRSRRVLTFACNGVCHSRSIPYYDILAETLYMVTHCMCCKPYKIVTRMVELNCRGRIQKREVGAAMKCSCRPCSDNPHVQAERPYDYVAE
jgi:hypothetical protein